MQIDTDFKALLGGHSPEVLDSETGTVVGLWPDGRIGLQNSAWRRFALDNAGSDIIGRWPLGSDLLSGISGELRGYYARAFARVTARQEPWEQTYSCHSPTLRRQYRLRALPLQDGGLLLVHSCTAEVPVLTDSTSAPGPERARYLNADGLIRQCSCCRRARRVGPSDVWDWVRTFIECPPPNVTHGICTTCRNQIYPDL